MRVHLHVHWITCCRLFALRRCLSKRCTLSTVFNLTSMLFENLLMFAQMIVLFLRCCFDLCWLFVLCLTHVVFQRCNPINYSELLVFIYLHPYILIGYSVQAHSHSHISRDTRTAISKALNVLFICHLSASLFLISFSVSLSSAVHYSHSSILVHMFLLFRYLLCYFGHHLHKMPKLLCTFTLIMFLRFER